MGSGIVPIKIDVKLTFVRQDRCFCVSSVVVVVVCARNLFFIIS